MRVLALDCSSRVGWAAFNSPHTRPRVGTWLLPIRHDLGPRFAALRDWLRGFVLVERPDVLAFEAPVTWVITDKGGVPNATASQVRLLVGIVAVVEMVAFDIGVRCIEVGVADAKFALAGTSRAKKRDMTTAATRRGWLVRDDHQADACAVGLATYHHLGLATP